jgi:hypothetical protein
MSALIWLLLIVGYAIVLPAWLVAWWRSDR